MMRLLSNREGDRRMPKVLLLLVLLALAVTLAAATELKQETATAFDQYVRATEARMEEDVRQNQFLAVDRLPESRRREVYDQLQRGEIYVEALRTREDGTIHVPSGLVHHWVAIAFIPKARLSEALAVLKDYDNQQNIYKPDVRRSKLLEHQGDESKIFLQFFNKSLDTVVLDAEFDVRDTQFGSNQYQIASRSTRIAEVANPNKPDAHERPVGKDHGYMWRLDTYWRIEEKDNGVYVQNESVALTRTVPVLLAWLVNPLIKSIPRGILMRLLNATRKAVNERRASLTAMPLRRRVSKPAPLSTGKSQFGWMGRKPTRRGTWVGSRLRHWSCVTRWQNG